MPRAVRDTRLETRAARERLSPRHEPYWRLIDRGAHLGYRKGKSGGSWIARYRCDGSPYKKKTLGRADDKQDSDGATVLTFGEAQEKARAYFNEHVQGATGHKLPTRYTVRDAATDYLEAYEGRGRGKQTTEYAINAHVLPALGSIEIKKLTKDKIQKWHRGVAEMPARVRTRNIDRQKYKDTQDGTDAIRQRRATANRILATLRACLNYAFSEGRATSDAEWRRVKPFKDVDAPKIRYLSRDECTRLMNACAPDFRLLVQAALLTGCRYGELALLRCGDFNADVGTIYVRASKTGKTRNVPLNEEGKGFFEDVTAGRDGKKMMFRREAGGAWGRAHQQRRMSDAAKIAKIEDVSFHILRHTYGSALVQQGVSMAVIAAALGHKDTRMAERHYAHLGSSYVAKVIREKLPPLGIARKGNVHALRLRKQAT